MRVLGVIMEKDYQTTHLSELSTIRNSSALPVGGSYRAIDFSMSNMANSRVNKVAVITQFKPRSLQDHLSSAKWWDLGRKQGGLFIFTPFLTDNNYQWFRGTADALYQNMSYLKRSNEPYVLIVPGDAVYKMDFNDLVAYHEHVEADVTMVYKKINEQNLSSYDILEFDIHGRVINIEEKPLEPMNNHACLGIYLMSRTLLITMLEKVIEEGRYELMRDIFIRYRKKLKIYGYAFDGYWNMVGNSVNEYYQTNMDFLNADIRNSFIHRTPSIETKPKDEPPSKYNYLAQVNDSLISGGCIINGSVSNSVLFRKVRTGEMSKITNSIVMEGSYVGNQCIVEYAILDKEVIISDGKNIVGTREKPIIVKKGTVL